MSWEINPQFDHSANIIEDIYTTQDGADVTRWPNHAEPPSLHCSTHHTMHEHAHVSMYIKTIKNCNLYCLSKNGLLLWNFWSCFHQISLLTWNCWVADLSQFQQADIGELTQKNSTTSGQPNADAPWIPRTQAPPLVCFLGDTQSTGRGQCIIWLGCLAQLPG